MVQATEKQGDGEPTPKPVECLVTKIKMVDRVALLGALLETDNVRYFYSSNTDNADLSSFHESYSFWGKKLEMGQGLDFLANALHGKFFRSREHFFQYAKCHFVGLPAALAEAAAGLADELLGMSPLAAKRATGAPDKGGRLKGLDVAEWEKVKGLVMAVGALMQAEGCKAFAKRLDETGEALLVEAKSFDSWWGVGMTVGNAMKTPKAARKMAWGRNEAGVSLMLARATRARGDG